MVEVEPGELAAGRQLFGEDAANYDRSRPEYPARVFAVLRERCGLGPGVRTLEIGAGSGKATRPLLAAGANPLVAVEPDERLAGYLLSTVPEGSALEVLRQPFEDVTLESGSYDLVASATAFHWLEQGPALRKVYEALRPGGALALWWNVYGDPSRYDAYHEATQELLGPISENQGRPDSRPPFALDVVERTAHLEAAGFRDVWHEIIRWEHRMTPPEVRGLYASFSNLARVEHGERERILDELERIAEVEFGGVVVREFVTAIYTARRPM
jgi:SAM-dependent methyltransferase